MLNEPETNACISSIYFGKHSDFSLFFVTIFVSIRQKSDLQNVELSLFCDDLVRLDGSVNVLFNIDTVRCFSLTNQRTKNLTHYIVLNFQSH